MSPSTSLPSPVHSVVATYLDLLGRHGAGFVASIHLVGSIALDDYVHGVSDIDFVAVTSRELDGADIDRLESVHATLVRLGGPSFDGFYVVRGRLARAADPDEPAPQILDGVFARAAPCFQINPVTWRCLARSPVTTFGPQLDAVDVFDDDGALEDFQRANLKTYWRRWTDDCAAALARKKPDALVSAAALSWGVLGVARIACTLATGRIVSKTAAGHWAHDSYDIAWRPPIEDALAARTLVGGTAPPHRFEPALAFMRHVIDGAGRI